MELYDYTRGQWKLSPERARNARYGFAVYQGVIQEVYEILHWYPAGKTFSVREDNTLIERGANEGLDGRYEFVGNLAPMDVRKKYKFKSVEHYFKKGNSNPILYIDI